MPPETEKQAVDLVEIDSSDDEGGRGTSTIAASEEVPPGFLPQTNSTVASPSSLARRKTLECRSFWKAGDCVGGPTSTFVPASGSLEHARVHPKFLHSNATSHKWAFGAIAELLDNAVDEVQNGATFVKVDKVDIMKDNSPALLFQDDGGGMDPDGIRKCMSLGYSSKKSKTTIGQYGNGFKTSTMRLGADVIVFSHAIRGRKETQSVGLLSYTFLRTTGQDDVIVPMIDFDVSHQLPKPILYGSEKDWSANLSTILEWSPFASKEELLQQFEDIGSHGTKIIIYNLWLNDEGIYELNFDDDNEDIRLRDEVDDGKKLRKNIAELRSHISYRLRFSLRAYASMLYLRKFKNFRIILRGKPVEQFNIADGFNYPKVVTYKPQVISIKSIGVEITIGFIKEAPSISVTGFNVYHKNRLIKPFWKVTPDGSSKGYGVVGVLEANFIEPAHDKQDFERSPLYVRLESKLKQILMEYWYGHCHLYGYKSPLTAQDKQPRTTNQLPQEYVGNFSLPDQRNVIPSDPGDEMHLDQNALNPENASQNLRSRTGGGDLGTEIANESVEDVTLEDDMSLMSTDQICEENLKLFVKCEEYAKEEAQLIETIKQLEKDLEETKNKCGQLSELVEAKRKEKAMNQRHA